MRLGTSLRGKQEVPLLIILGACTLLAAGAARVWWSLGGETHSLLFCPFRRLTGLPCPTCGATRAFAALGRGDLRESFAMNPLLTLGALGILAAAVASLARRIAARPAIRVRLSPGDHRALRISCVVALGANWLYLLFHLNASR